MSPITMTHVRPTLPAEKLEPKSVLAPKPDAAAGAKAAATTVAKGGAAADTKTATAAKGPAKVDPKVAQVAHEFEAIFLRNLLKPLEGAGSIGKKGNVTSGGGVYGSMMVGAMADSASKGGGIGLAHVVLEALTRGQVVSKIGK